VVEEFFYFGKDPKSLVLLDGAAAPPYSI